VFPDAPPVGHEPLVPRVPDAWPQLQVDPVRAVSPARAAAFGGVAGAIVVALLAAIVGLVAERGDSNKPTTAANRPAVSAAAGDLDIQGILADVERSVVAVETSTITSQGIAQGAGSGIVLTDDGLVLTNDHVIGSPNTPITVVLWDGSRHDAELVGSVPENDLAVIKLTDSTALTPATLGSSADMLVGDPVVAIGNALNLGTQPSVTLGILSAKDRTLEDRGIALSNLLQTDAAINPGNSGGPLVNAAGEVIGINTAIAANGQNIGFAIAIDTAKPIIDRIEAGNATVTPDTAFLGVRSDNVTDLASEILDFYGITADTGAVIIEVTAGQAADDAGIEVGDVIVSIGERKVANRTDVLDAVRAHKAGDHVTVTFERRGERQQVEVTMGRRG
jgi:putative serine protease PepD